MNFIAENTVIMEKSIAPRELPFKQFEKIGLSKEDVLNLPKQDLKNLLSGYRTDIVPLKIDQDGLNINIEGKLSLKRNNDDTVSLIVHPSRKEIDNQYNLNEEQLNRLKKGEILELDLQAKNKEITPHLVQLDQSINELISAVKDNIRIPEKIQGIQLSNEQKELIASGKSVSLSTDKGEVKVQLNLNDSSGIRIDSPLGYDRNNKLDQSTKEDLKR